MSTPTSENTLVGKYEREKLTNPFVEWKKKKLNLLETAKRAERSKLLPLYRKKAFKVKDGYQATVFPPRPAGNQMHTSPSVGWDLRRYRRLHLLEFCSFKITFKEMRWSLLPSSGSW